MMGRSQCHASQTAVMSGTIFAYSIILLLSALDHGVPGPPHLVDADAGFPGDTERVHYLAPYLPPGADQRVKTSKGIAGIAIVTAQPRCEELCLIEPYAQRTRRIAFRALMSGSGGR